MQMTIDACIHDVGFDDACINDGDFLVTQEQEQDKHVLGVRIPDTSLLLQHSATISGKKALIISENHKISIFLQIRIVVKGFHPLVVPSAGSYCHERQ